MSTPEFNPLFEQRKYKNIATLSPNSTLVLSGTLGGIIIPLLGENAPVEPVAPACKQHKINEGANSCL